MLRHALLGLGLACMVWIYGVYVATDGIPDGPCFTAGSEFEAQIREGSAFHNEFSWLPPRETCVEERRGAVVREQSYPGKVTFALAALAFLAPPALGVARRRR